MDRMQADLRDRCQRLVPQVLARHGWLLVEDETAFIADVQAEAQSRLPNARRTLDQVIEDATVNCYNHLWHAACRDHYTLRQRRAFEELHGYLYRIALYNTNNDRFIAEECAQEALIIVWQRLDQVRDPGSFMRWASMIVIHLVTRKLAPTNEITDADLEPNADEVDLPEGASAVDRPAPPDSPQMTEAIRARLEAAIKTCLSSDQQIAVIIGIFLDERTYKEMADELNTSVDNVSVLKSRALTKLKQCTDFLNALEELL